ncbi:hypothetical protein Hanom_Chr15g01401031 [Helianthus anomalus]
MMFITNESIIFNLKTLQSKSLIITIKTPSSIQLGSVSNRQIRSQNFYHSFSSSNHVKPH